MEATSGLPRPSSSSSSSSSPSPSLSTSHPQMHPTQLNQTELNDTLGSVAHVHLPPSMQLGTMSNPQSRLRDLTGLAAMVALNAVALLANVAVLAVVVKAPHLRKFSFVGHLCAVDLLCASLLMPLGTICGSPLFAGVVFSVLECRLYVFLNAFLVSASIFTVTVISVERYYYIVHPMRYEAKMTSRLAAAVMVLVWVAAALLGLATVIGWPDYGPRSSVAAAHCSLHWSHSGHRRVFSVLFCVVCFCVPAAVILGVYANVYKVAHSAARHRGPLPNWVSARTPRTKRRSDSVNSQTTIITSSASTGTGSSARRGTTNDVAQIRRPRRVLVGGKAALTLAVIVGQFILCWLPYFAFHLHLSLGFAHNTADEAEVPVTWLAYSSFAANPFFYGLLNRQIREELCKILCCCFCCRCRAPGRTNARPMASTRDASAHDDFLHFLNRSGSVPDGGRGGYHMAGGTTPRATNATLDQSGGFRIPGQIPEEVT